MTSADPQSQSRPADIAQRFLAARQAADGLSDYPGTPPATLDEAYIIQDLAIAASVEPIAGWKVGRIIPPLSGIDRLSGPIFASAVAHATADSEGYIFADGFGAAEAEFLLRIGVAPEAGKKDFTLEEAAACIDAVHIGIEIASSPFRGINSHGPTVTISDFGNNNGLLIGPAIANFRDTAYIDEIVTVTIDGVVEGAGRASAFPDGVIGSARFLFENLAARGIVLAPGSWISSGAITGVHQVGVGQEVMADFGQFGSLSCSIRAQQPD